MLTGAQLEVVSEIGVVIGQLSAASMVLPFVVPGLDDTKLQVITLGLLLTFGSWSLSVIVARKVTR